VGGAGAGGGKEAQPGMVVLLDWEEHYSEFRKKRIGAHHSTASIAKVGLVRVKIRSFPDSL